MSKIEEDIQSERRTAEKRAEAKAIAEATAAAKKRAAFVAEEQPRITQFKKKINKAFPCLKGDFKVEPRSSASESFAAIVTVHRTPLEIREGFKDKYTLSIPYEVQGDWGYGWKTQYNRNELKSDADLKERIKRFISECEWADKRAEEEWNNRPIGNTD